MLELCSLSVPLTALTSLLCVGLLSITECRAAVLADWHDRDDENFVPGTDGRGLVQLLLRIPSGLSVGTSRFLHTALGSCSFLSLRLVPCTTYGFILYCIVLYFLQVML